MIDQALLSKVKDLSPAERLEFIGVVWESLDANDVPVSEAEKALLDAWTEDELRTPDACSFWQEIEARLRARRR